MQIGAMVKKVPDGRKVAIVNGMLHGCTICHQDPHTTKLKFIVIKSETYIADHGFALQINCAYWIGLYIYRACMGWSPN